ncbi:HAMP domain-containing histidine kinase, partial [bacterium]|nr:HAMP domain-containing histidine kinase [bacterium]
AGMFRRADLGRFVSYSPVAVPGVHAAVMRVEYPPLREEAILDATRGPMMVVTVLSLLAALMLTMLTTGWTLSLVENLRRTADSVDVGQLDVRLPEEGQNEVAELARSLNRLIEGLQRRNEAQSRFIADASHELATPVAGIRGYVNILRAWGAEDPSLREEAVSAIDRESRRMARLCSDLLSVIRNEEVVEYRQIRYDINAVCREVLANAATRYIDGRLEFTGPSEGSMWLFGDPDRIEEALGILVDNACKYTPPGGSVSVTTRRHRDRVVVEIADTGVGIPEEDIPSIFDRFYRSDLSRSKETGGFGLGLAIARHIVDASGGSISVRSALGRGTTFEVTLPRQKR